MVKRSYKIHSFILHLLPHYSTLITQSVFVNLYGASDIGVSPDCERERDVVVVVVVDDDDDDVVVASVIVVSKYCSLNVFHTSVTLFDHVSMSSLK